MDKSRLEKKKKKSKSKRQSEDSNRYKYEEIVTHKFDISGVQRITLSSETQRAIGCIVGENISGDEPWIYIKKERFEDNLELHEGSSEFLPIKQEILEYPEEEMFVGFDTSFIPGSEEFYICLTKDGRDTILDILEREKRELDERLKNCLRRTVGKWNTLGSETEVEENIIQNMRPLMEIEVESTYPLSNTKTKFSCRPVDGAIDGYVELLPGRLSIDHVLRKRVDAAIQMAPDKKTNEAQTVPTYPSNIWTEYKYEYKEEKLTPEINMKLDRFALETTKPLFDMLQINANIELYLNDYGNLMIKKNPITSTESKEQFSFQDVVTCKKKQVSSMSWHPLMSGMVAAAYRKMTQNSMQSEASSVDEVNDTVYGENYILLWSYEDTLKPKLYLLSPREVNYVSFCPHDGNVLIGGCTNGQIVIWDNIDKKLEQVEAMDILTQNQERHRLILQSKMNWMKKTEDVAVVNPSVISDIDFSQKACITAIKWLPVDHIITRNGKIEEIVDRDFWNNQFLTSSMDGTVLLWDLDEELSKAEHTRRPGKQSKRLKKRPSALTINVSKFKVINKIFKPKFKLIVEDPDVKKSLPIANINIEKQTLTYTPINEDTLLNLAKRTKFEVSKLEHGTKFKPKFSVTSNTGRILNCFWEGHEFDQGKKINEEICSTKSFGSIHDAPIKTILRSPFLDRIIMTVGGRVFAIWDAENQRAPIVWRKSHLRYVAGMFSVYQTGVMAIARQDCHFEVWDLLHQTKAPSRIIRFIGNLFTDAFSDTLKVHSRKTTFCTTDSLGALKVYTYPEEYTVYLEESTKMAKLILQRTVMRREKLKKWLESWKNRHIETKESHIEKEEREHVEPSEQQDETKGEQSKKRRNSEMWREKEREGIFISLAEKNNIKLFQIKKNRKRMNKSEAIEQEIKNKEDMLLAKEHDMCENTKKIMLKETELKEHALTGYDALPTCITEDMKAYFLRNYKDMESLQLKYIKTHPYHHAFEWNDLIKDGNERRRMLNLVYNEENIHGRRYFAKKQMKDDANVEEKRISHDDTISLHKESTDQHLDID